MKNKILYGSLSITLALTLSGCFNNPTYTPPIYTPTVFTPKPEVYNNANDTEAVKVILNKVGRNNISGNAFMKQQGGGIVTCAGNQVALFPKTDYSTEYVQKKFVKNEYSDGYSTYGKGPQKANDLKNPYLNSSKVTTCDSQGNFEFQNIADGTYYVVTFVIWYVPNSYGTNEGANLLQEVELKNNSTKKIILTK